MLVAPGIMSVFMGNPKFSTNYRAPIYGGDRACTPEPPLRLAMVLYYLLWSYPPMISVKIRGKMISVAHVRPGFSKPGLFPLL